MYADKLVGFTGNADANHFVLYEEVLIHVCMLQTEHQANANPRTASR